LSYLIFLYCSFGSCSKTYTMIPVRQFHLQLRQINLLIIFVHLLHAPNLSHLFYLKIPVKSHEVLFHISFHNVEASCEPPCTWNYPEVFIFHRGQTFYSILISKLVWLSWCSNFYPDSFFDSVAPWQSLFRCWIWRHGRWIAYIVEHPKFFHR